MKKISVYAPECQVLLHKIVDRRAVAGAVPVSTRFSSSQGATIDLTPFLSEQGGIQTSKSVSAPAGGFTLTLVDKAYASGGGFESLYGMVEPMDMIEIRMAREPHKSAGGRLPIVMRGFVSEVNRSEAMTPDGRPSRVVTISGQDWGKIWQIIQLKYYGNYAIGEGYISGFNLFEKYGVGYETGMLSTDFLREVVAKVINPFLAEFIPDRDNLPKIITTEITAPEASVSVSGPQNQEGTLYGLLRTFLDVGAFNELFLEDREAGVVCVHRPNPFKDVAVAGAPFIQAGASAARVAVSGADIVSISLTRTDANVANWFWVTAPRFELLHNGTLKLFALQSALDRVSIAGYPNSSIKIYGSRVMEETTQQGLDTMRTSGGQLKAGSEKEEAGYAAWVNQRLDTLRNQNKDNVVFENGSITLKGNEAIKAGCYLDLTRGSMLSEFYVTSVTHQYVPFGAFTTTVYVDRGTSFIERVKRGAGRESPYLSELT